VDFSIPASTLQFAIPDEWWQFCALNTFRPRSEFYPYARDFTTVQAVPLTQIEPPLRDADVPPFKKYKLVPVLLGFTSPECAIQPVRVSEQTGGRYTYRVLNGYHRFYASIAVGYLKLPVIVIAE
jgi:hypothetical protein